MRDLPSVPAMRPPGSPRTGVPGRLEYERAAGERPPRARPQRRGSPGPIPNPAVKPAFAESTAAQGCGRAGRRARGGRFSICARGGIAAPGARIMRAGRGPQGIAPCGLLRIWRQSGLTMLAASPRRSVPRGLSSFRQPYPARLRAHRILKSRGESPLRLSLRFGESKDLQGDYPLAGLFCV